VVFMLGQEAAAEELSQPRPFEQRRGGKHVTDQGNRVQDILVTDWQGGCLSVHRVHWAWSRIRTWSIVTAAMMIKPIRMSW